MSDNRDRLEQTLHALFYRASCPAPKILGDYYLGRLPPGQRLAVALHLRYCPHCVQELSFYGDNGEDLPIDEARESTSGRLAWLHRVVPRVRWAIGAPNLLPTQPMRGGTYTQQAFQAGDIQIVIEIGPARAGHRRVDIIGQIQPVGAAGLVELWDAHDTAPPAVQPLDEMGYFEFQGLQPSAYFLCLRAGESETWVGKVTIEPPAA